MYTICDNPSVIIHPNVISHCQRATHIYKCGYVRELRTVDYDEIYSDFYRWFNANFPQKTAVSDVKQYAFILDGGEMLPVYLEVACGHCDCCRVRKMNSYVQQLEFELLDEHELCSNFFVTLTYNDENCPTNVQKKHIQDYIKRIRTYVRKNIGIEESRAMKVMYSAEYGTRNTMRPHYHIAFLHFPLYKFSTLPFQTSMLFEYCWSKTKNINMKNAIPFSEYKINHYGRKTEAAQLHYDTYNYGIVKVKQLYSGNAAKYLAKYIGKGCETQYLYVFKDSKPLLNDNGSPVRYERANTFFRKSINMGMSYFNKHIIPQIEVNKRNSFTYRNLSNKIKEDSHLCSYYINKIFPSLSRVIPAEIRRQYMRIRQCIYDMTNYSLFRRKGLHLINWVTHEIPQLFLVLASPTDNNHEYNKQKMFSYKFHKYNLLDAVQEVKMFFEDKYDDLCEYFRKRSEFLYNSFSGEIPIPDSIFDCHKQMIQIKQQIKI